MQDAFNEGAVAIGVDIGGTKIRAGLVRRDGAVLKELTLPALAEKRRVMDQVFLAINTLRMYGEETGSGTLAGIGVGSAGQIDFERGSVHFASDLIPGYTGMPIRELIEKKYALPVYVDNDVNVMALAEHELGAGKGCRHLVCLALGTGVGGAVITDNRLLHGARGGAGEIGHLSVDLHGPRCICGNRGCVEVYASGTSIAGRYREEIAAQDRALMKEAPADTRQIVTRWLDGEPAAGKVMEDAIAALGSAVTSLIHVFNPQAVIIGGGLAEIGEPLFAPLRQRVEATAMASMRQEVRILPAELGGGSNMIGAALQVWVYGRERAAAAAANANEV
ncbi:ROK family protein [Gorillibacterium timonense]|uniref:ROK family protein n=1 Tax=Gorillibacterium timonense TaxID=1689269 RepID=UPI00071CAC16|nr:ROK family protein [Gorillibacterium timonense]